MDQSKQVGGPGSKRVLVIDDDDRLLTSIRERLARAGYDVKTRSTAVGATALLLGEDFDFVLLDLLMPGMRPEAMLRLVERPNRSRKTHLVLLTNLKSVDVEPLLMTTGAIAAIDKSTTGPAFGLAFERCVRLAEKRASAEPWTEQPPPQSSEFESASFPIPSSRRSPPASSREIRTAMGELSQKLDRILRRR